jgi:hypothetical protein
MTKTLKGIICGLIAISIISIACTGAVVGNTDAPAKMEAAIQSKVGADSLPVAGTSAGGVAGAYAGSYFPEYQKITVDPAYKYLQMKPGDSESFTVTVTNNENKTVKLKPRILITPYTQYFMNESWVSINPSEKSLKSGEKVEFEVKVSIPKDANVGSYAVLIAFADKVPEGDVAGIYPNFPGTMQLNVQVWIPPAVQILTPYVSDLVEAGKDYTYEIKLKNTGDKDIAISPKLAEGGSVIYYGYAASSSAVSSSGSSSSAVSSNAVSSNAVSSNAVTSSESPSSAAASIMAPSAGSGQTFGNEAISIEAPDKIKAGETAVVKLKIAVPANAKGSYSGSLELHIDDPGIINGGSVPLNFRILPILKDPYEITFEARTNDPITVEVKAYQYGYSIYTAGGNRDITASFNVGLKDPSGKEVKPVLVSTKSIGSVSIVDGAYPQPYPLLEKSSNVVDSTVTSNEGSYQGGTTTFVETYTAPGAAGKWTLSILPKNTDNFEYSVTIGAAGN